MRTTLFERVKKDLEVVSSKVRVFRQEGETLLDGALFCAKLASISYDKKEPKDAFKLAVHLLKHGHWSPFEFFKFYDFFQGRYVSLREIVENEFDPDDLNDEWIYLVLTPEELPSTGEDEFPIFEIKAPTPTAVHFWRHRTFVFLSVSNRYVDAKRRLEEFVEFSPSEIKKEVKEVADFAYERYEQIKAKFPREVARSVLPMGTFYTFYMTPISFVPTEEALANFFVLRANIHAQYETALYAIAMFEKLKESFPSLVRVIEEIAPAINPQFRNSIFALGTDEVLSRLGEKRYKRAMEGQ